MLFVMRSVFLNCLGVYRLFMPISIIVICRLMFLVPICCNFYTCEPCKQQLVIFFFFFLMHREVPVSCCNDDVMNFLCTSCYALFIHYWRLMFLVPFCCNFYTCDPCKQQLVNFNVFMHCEIPASCCNDDVMNFFMHFMLCFVYSLLEAACSQGIRWCL